MRHNYMLMIEGTTVQGSVSSRGNVDNQWLCELAAEVYAAYVEKNKLSTCPAAEIQISSASPRYVKLFKRTSVGDKAEPGAWNVNIAILAPIFEGHGPLSDHNWSSLSQYIT